MIGSRTTPNLAAPIAIPVNVQPWSVIADTGQMATLNPPSTADTHSAREPGPGLWLSIITLSIGVGAFSWGAYTAFQSAFELVTVDSFETPGEQTRSLDSGEYEIYVRSASLSILDLDIEYDDTGVTLDQITVTNVSTGASVPLEPLFTAEPLSRSANIYDGVASFDVPASGKYIVAVDTDGPSRAVVGRSLETAFDRIVPWIILTAVGLVLFVLGLVLLVVGIVRRKRARDGAGITPPPYEAQPPTASTPHVPAPPPPRPTETQTPWDS